MNAIEWIVVWGAVALLAGVAGAIVAGQKNRDASYWGAWCFLLPPLVFALLALPRLEQAASRRPTLDEDDDIDPHEDEDVDPH